MQPVEIVAFLYQISDVFAFLVLAAAGLAIIFGMMGIINMAHGEFIAMGGYVTTYAYHAGVPLPLAMLLGAVACGLFGVFLERTIVRRFYHRPINSLVATWGISLIMTQGALLLLGSGAPGVGTPFGSVSFGGASFSIYRLVLVAVAVAVLVGLYLLFMKTRFGRHARATMQNAAMARALGVPVNGIYSITFGLGAALAGLAGGLYAPTMTLSPMMGGSFVIEAFVTVVAGGADVLIGTPPAAMALAVIKATATAVLRPGLRRHEPADRRLSRRPPAAGRLHRLADPPPLVRGPAMRAFFSLLNGPQTFGNSRGFWAAAIAVFVGGAALPPGRRQLHGRQPRLLRRMGLHGARPVADLGLRRHAELRPDRLLRPRRLQLRRHRHQSRRELRLSRPGPVLRAGHRRRCSRSCSATS